MNRSSRHFERDQEKQDRLLGLIAVKDTWEIWLGEHPAATEIKGEPIDLDYVDELGQRINDLRGELLTFA